jgi:hypothetical protein
VGGAESSTALGVASREAKMTKSKIRVFYLALTVGGLFSGIAHADLCLPPANMELDSPYRYVLGLTDAFAYGKQGVERFGKYFENEGILELMWVVKREADDYLCAAAQVEPYRKSKVEAIAGSADGVVNVFSLLAQHNQAFNSKLKAVLFSSGSTTAKRGTTTETIADLRKLQDDTWKLLAPSTLLATYSLAEADPETHRMSRSRLSTSEREEIKNRLIKTFGKEITEGIKAGQPAITASAAVVYHFVADSALQSADAKK